MGLNKTRVYVMQCLNWWQKPSIHYLPRDTLLNVLEHYGVSGIVLELVKNHLFQRKQMVEIINSLSNPEEVKIGVPQLSNSSRTNSVFSVYKLFILKYM